MAVSNSLTNTPKQQVGITSYLNRADVHNQIASVVGKHTDGFVTSIVSAVQANPALQECTKSSILSAALLGEGLKLSPSPQLGHYYMVPFNTKVKVTDASGKTVETWEKKAQFQLGYKGYIQLAIRSGQYRKINVLAIKEGELIRFNPLEETIEVQLIENEEERENTPTIGYYAMFEYINGFRKAMYWSRAKMEAHANKYSKGYAARKGYTFWEKDFDGMAIKTMIRQLISKWGIMSIDMQTAYEADEAVIKEDGSVDYVDTKAEEIEAQPARVIQETAAVQPEQPQGDAASVLFG